MRYPFLNPLHNKAKQSIINFLGINYGNNYMDGQLSNCHNLSTDAFPCLTQRAKRIKIKSYTSPTTLYSKGGLFVVDGTDLIYKNKVVGQVTEGKKQMCAVGKYVVIFPDKKYYDTENEKFGSMEETYTSGAGQITFTATSDGSGIKYATLTTTGTAFSFKKGDAVEISGCTKYPENNKTIIIREVDGKTLKFYENSFTAGKETAAVTIKRAIPDLEFICENNYRLWGCAKNTIYASAYGDPLNFQVFDNLSTDSYFIEVSSDGAFTGCITYTDYVCFFKEDVIHQIYGNKPSVYQMLTANAFGVKKGCERSLHIVNETLYYLSKNGVYAYTGGKPECISPNFGTVRFKDACAGSDGNKYYICMTEADDEETAIYTYDIELGIWLKTDNIHVVDFADIDNELYFVAEDNNLYKVAVDGDKSAEVIPWSATFCPFTEIINERKGYSKLNFRVDLADEAWFKIELKTDDKPWKTIYTSHNQHKKTHLIPIFPNRCDKFQVRISGEGDCTIKSFVRDFFVGSDI